jgi:hypothetical protein
MIWRIGFENEGRAHAAYMRYSLIKENGDKRKKI